jgi:hypothetical protein
MKRKEFSGGEMLFRKMWFEAARELGGGRVC